MQRRPSVVTPLAQIHIGRSAVAYGCVSAPYNCFPRRTAAEVEHGALTLSTARPSDVRYPFNLVEYGEHRILINADTAYSIGETAPLPQALGAVGLQRGRMDAVIVTHMHQNRMGGLIVGGKNNYPNAKLYIDRRDVGHWTDPAKRSGAPDYLQASFRMAGEAMPLCRKL